MYLEEPQCRKCLLYKNCQSPKMANRGRGETKLLIVGEAPGPVEDRGGKPFAGPSGQVLKMALQVLGVDLEFTLMTNAVICHPHGTPSDSQIRYCQPNVTKTIIKFKPHVVLCCGMGAVKSVLGVQWERDFGKMSRWQGLAIPFRVRYSEEMEMMEFWVVSTYNPAYVLRQNDQAIQRVFLNDVALAISKLNEPIPPLPKIDIHFVTSSVKAADTLKFILEKSPECVAFDYETNMLKPFSPKSKIVSVSMAYRDGDIVMGIAFPMFNRLQGLWKQFLTSSIKKICANMKFEYVWSKQMFGVEPKHLIFDSILWGHFQENYRRSNSLKFHVFTKYGIVYAKRALELRLQSPHPLEPNRIHEIPLLELLVYGAFDSVYEYLLWEAAHENY